MRDKKKRKTKVEEQDEDSVLDDLKDLLRPLLDDNGDDDTPIVIDDAKAIFEQHVGPYPTVLEMAASHVVANFYEEFFYLNSGYDRSFGRYGDPLCPHIVGPKPNLHVWMGLFLGREREAKSRQRYSQDKNQGLVCYSDINEAFHRHDGEIRTLPIAQLTRNVLSYLSIEAKTLSRANLLRFCATYGLSHALRDVLDGKYGSPVDEDLTINSALQIPTERDPPYRIHAPIGMPVLGIAAVLGYHHLVRHALENLRASWQASFVIFLPDGSEQDMEFIGAKSLAWVIASKQPEMIQHLVDCGVQFCWLSSEMFRDLFEILFHTSSSGSSDEYGPRWQEQGYDPQEAIMSYGSMHDVRRYRARSCYKEKQKVVSALVDAGLPRELFIPSMDVSIDARLMEEAKAKGLEGPDRAMCKKADRMQSRSERRARMCLTEACAAYNSVTKRADQKTVVDFYQHLLDLWSKQKSAQRTYQPWWEHRSDYEEEEEYESDKTDDSTDIY